MHTMWRTKKMENQREIGKKNKRFQIKNAGLTKNFWDTGRVKFHNNTGAETESERQH